MINSSQNETLQNLKHTVFIDTEIDPKNHRVLDIGGVGHDGSSFHSNSIPAFVNFLKGAKYVCGHNILNHDIKYIHDAVADAGIDQSNAIDTLFLSPLLFPKKPYHSLVKDDKLQTDDINNPLNDSKKAMNLFLDEVSAFVKTDGYLRQILHILLKDRNEFRAFFDFLSCSIPATDVVDMIKTRFHGEICGQSSLSEMVSEQPVELAYALVMIDCKNRSSIIPPWVLRNFPEVESVMFKLRNKPCLSGCEYCNQAFDINKGLKNYFGFDSYRLYAGEPLQEKAVKAAVDNKSFLAVFPTGGGKSITFQVPALMSGRNTKGLTVVISPLQSLMKDQVDNLERVGITEAVTINGLLDPIERGKSFQRIEDGSASILYIAPESLRSRTIERVLLGRKITRFVIDEAHCFSSWGQDFRVDYLYVGDFIKSLQEKKNLEDGIPVSCFTATAKQKVIEDIRNYFREKLSIDLDVFSSSASRTNLQYRVFSRDEEEAKYTTVRELISEYNCPTIIYTSRTRKAYDLAERLTRDGFNAKPYHGKIREGEDSQPDGIHIWRGKNDGSNFGVRDGS